jgi:hypothetical protein
MTGQLLLRGIIVGLIAGLFAFGFARVFGEPMVDRAIAFEEQQAQKAGEAAEEPELVSRATQAGSGLLTGTLVYGAAVGGLFSLVFAFAYGRIGRLGPRGTAAVLAACSYLAVTVLPFLKYPANPPAVGNPDTIGERTTLFFVLILACIAGMVLAFMLARNLIAKLGVWNGVIAAGLAYLVFVAIVQALLPSINDVPENFSAYVLWNFRVATFGMHAIVWAVLGLLFGWVAERALIKQGSYRPTQLAR